MGDACGIAVAEGRSPVALAVELAARRDNGDPPRRHRPPVGCPLMDALLAETATRILSDLADSPESLWTALEDNGLTRVWAAEADGGFDLDRKSVVEGKRVFVRVELGGRGLIQKKKT